jgi:hypothetical protein
MKKQFHPLLLMLLLFLSHCQCGKKLDVSNSSAADLSPKQPQFVKAAPNAVTFMVQYDGTKATLVESRLRNAAISSSISNITDIDIITGKGKLFDFKAFATSGALIFSERIRVSVMMRTNYPNNNKVLHDEHVMPSLNFSVSIPYLRDSLPASVFVREIPVIEGKIDSLSIYTKKLQLRTFQFKVDSIIK